MEKRDIRVELFKNEEPCGEILRFYGNVVHSTVETLDRDVAMAIGAAMETGDVSSAVISGGDRYTWNITELTDEQMIELSEPLIQPGAYVNCHYGLGKVLERDGNTIRIHVHTFGCRPISVDKCVLRSSVRA